ncbi:MAG: M15 family metallopeptidase [Myxococcota bacterium]
MARMVTAGVVVLAMLACGASPPAPAPAAPAPAPAPVEAEPAPAPVEAAPAPDLRNRPPEGWVDLAEHVPGIVLEVRYATPDNFTGAQLPGYGVPGAWMRQAPADALARVQAALKPKGLGLKVYDAYRPLRATKGMVAWAKRADKVYLLDQHYVSRYSGHNRGDTIDLSAIRLSDGEELDFGTPWDTLSEDSHTKNATGKALENRMMLKDAMRVEGFVNYWKEWWHYVFQEPGEKELPHRDVPYACFEPPEGEWTPPAGWDAPGYDMPLRIAPQPCR